MSPIDNTKTVRDPRLDFFRGVAMLIIFIAHVPSNRIANYIPARFGFSDAAEMFVFLSGMAAAIVFAGTYRRAGFATGTARIGYRCFQLYTAHLGMFFLIATICVLANNLTDGPNYIGKLNLWRFFQDTPEAMIGLFSLTYVPNYFDIMPMYLGVLALVPVVMALARVNTRLVPVFCLSLYAAMWIFDLSFLADSTNGRSWFFNPFGWQLIFFTGFCLGTGWIKPPPRSAALFWGCVVFVLLCVPLGRWQIWTQYDSLKAMHGMLSQFWIHKTNFGLLRWFHFLALAYIAVYLLRGRLWILRSKILAPIIKTGQNALPVFFLSMTLSYIAGIALDSIGRTWPTIWLVNLSGLAILLLAAYGFGWFKQTPWKRKPVQVNVKAGINQPESKHA